MKSKDIEQQLSELVDGTLPVEQAERVKRRLAADPALAEEHRLYASLAKVLDEMAAEPVPEVDWELQRQTIQSRMERAALLAPPASAWSRRLVRWSAAVTAAAAILAIALLGRWWLLAPGAGEPAPSLEVVWASPTTAADEGLAAGPVRPVAEATEELVVAYNPSAGALAGPVQPVSALAAPGRAGTIIISVAAPAPAADWAWEGL